MTRKDFELIAAALKRARADVIGKEHPKNHADMLDGVSLAADHLAAMCAAQNPRFDRAKFLTACGQHMAASLLQNAMVQS